MGLELGRVGIWHRYDVVDPEVVRHAEAAGYGTVWVGGLPPGQFSYLDGLLTATERIVVATGIVNMWGDPPGEVAAVYRRLTDKHPGRFLLGLGVGHREAVPGYRSHLGHAAKYLDRLDEEAVPRDARVLAALGPRMLELAAARTAGAHPYLVTPDHTRFARQILGPDALLAPEQKVLLASGPEARVVAREAVMGRLRRQNYRNHLARMGWAEADVVNGGSDRLIDALVAWGSLEAVLSQVLAHFDAGADHVAIQALGPDPSETYQLIAEALV